MTNEGTSGQTNRNEFPRPLSLWGSKMKTSLDPYLVSWTNRTEFIGPFSLGSKRVHNGSEPLKIIENQTSA